MQDLVGKVFAVGDSEYRVVDVRNLNGESMVYAEVVEKAVAADGPRRRPQRMAFHFSDIAELIDASGNKTA